MANKFDNLIGKKVVATRKQGENLFVEGNEYTVTGTGVCGYGTGVTTAELGRIYVLAEGNFKEAENVPVKPAPLDLRGLLFALYDDEEVVSVDGDDEVTDTYVDLENLADDLCQFEIEENVFYLKEDWDVYRKAVEEADRKANPELDFEQALELLEQGIAVTSFDSDGDEVDTYHTVKDLAQLAGFEIEGVWRKA